VLVWKSASSFETNTFIQKSEKTARHWQKWEKQWQKRQWYVERLNSWLNNKKLAHLKKIHITYYPPHPVFFFQEQTIGSNWWSSKKRSGDLTIGHVQEERRETHTHTHTHTQKRIKTIWLLTSLRRVKRLEDALHTVLHTHIHLQSHICKHVFLLQYYKRMYSNSTNIHFVSRKQET